MPRRGRKQSGTGVYHVMIRGINQQNIFEDDEDCERMLQILSDVRAVSKCKIFAYCLMGNHCHLLLKVEGESLEQVIKRIGARYVYWFNVKYKRAGHLFQDRYKSEAVENDTYLLSVLRYIHQNPLQANLCNRLSDYPWSSYNEYIGIPKIIDSTFVFGLVSKKEFEMFSRKESAGEFLECKKSALRVSDTEAKAIIEEVSKCSNASEFQRIDSIEKREFLKVFKEKGVSIRQISRLTGISKGIIERS